MSGLPRAVRVTAGNAGPFTGSGTNTYVLGSGEARVVIDPGPHDPAHMAAIVAAAGGHPISYILVTHAHRDHVDGLAALKAATGAATYGYGRAPRLPGAVHPASESPSGGDFVDDGLVLDHLLRDGDVVTAPGIALTAIHTPGHAPDHLCFALGGSRILFSGDHVMGWSTSVIAPPEGHMGAYLASLEKLQTLPASTYLPGHGEEIADGLRTVRAYLVHRQMRERAVLDVIRAGGATVQSVTEAVYAGIAENLANAARISVIAHVELLAEKGLVTCDGALEKTTRIAAC